MKKKKSSVFCLRETLLQMVFASVGSEMFQNSYFVAGGKRKDLCQNGKFSCAFYVSSILKIFDLIETLHTTIDGLEKDLFSSDWRVFTDTFCFQDGDIIIWEVDKKIGNHRHAGFYIGDFMCVSNSSDKGRIIRHGLEGPNLSRQRRIEKIYRHPKMSDR